MGDLSEAIRALIERTERLEKMIRRHPKGSPRGGQFRGAGATTALSLAATHPKGGENGEPITIHYPSQPTTRGTWHDRHAEAVFVPGGANPPTINGVPFAPWTPPKSWGNVAGQKKLAEPPLPTAKDAFGMPKRAGAGVVIREPDGRVWIIEPTNHFGGYQHTFPKGGAEPGIKRLQANAIKEAWEETGLKVKITGLLGDHEGDTSITRYYLAERVGGTPKQAGWETQAVKLVPAELLRQRMNRSRDKAVAEQAIASWEGGIAKALLDLDRLEKVIRRWPKGHPKGGQFMPGNASGSGSSKGKKGKKAKPAALASAAAAAAVANAKDAVPAAAASIGPLQPVYVTGKNPDNSALKSANKAIDGYIALGNAGDLATLQANPPHVSAKPNPYQKGKLQNWEAAVAHAQILQASGAGDGATPASIKGAPLKLADMTYHAPKPGGSSKGGIYTDADGQRWLVKSYNGGSESHARNEVLASRLYNAAGAHAPEMRLVELSGDLGSGIGVASKWQDGPLDKVNASAQTKKAAQEDFAVDVWLANWDAVGEVHDNIVINASGQAMRIDTGGALLYRAKGDPKGAAFNAKASEWHTLRDPTENQQAASIYGGMSALQLMNSANKVAAVPNDVIKSLVDQYGPGSAADKAALTDLLIARKSAVMDHAVKTGEVHSATLNATLTALAAKTKPAEAQQLPPTYKGTSADFWTNQTAKFNAAVAAGDTALADKLGSYTPKHSAGSPNHAAFAAYVAAVQGKPDAPAAKPETKPKAEAKPDAVTPIKPGKPADMPSALLTSATNPNKTLVAKVGEIDAAKNAFDAGTLSKAEAIAQISAVAVGTAKSNTFYKKAQAHQADVLAWLDAPAVAIPDAPAPKAAKPTKAPKAAPVFDPAKLTELPDFHNYNGPGKGLSTKPHINDANLAEAKVIQAIAQTGDLAALQAYIPKSPSSKISTFQQKLIEDVNNQLNPPKPPVELKVSAAAAKDHTYSQALAELAAQVPPLKTVGQITNKLAFYPALGSIKPSEQYKPPVALKWENGASGLTIETFAATGDASFGKLNAGEKNAVMAYTGQGYEPINDSLRAGKPTAQAKVAAQGVAKAATELPAGTVLSRKIRQMTPTELEIFLSQGEGKVIQEFGISSTSINPVAWHGVVHMRITTAPGARGLYVGEGTTGDNGSVISHHSGEREMLIPANARYLITKIHPEGYTEKTGDGQRWGGHNNGRLVEVTLLPPE